jgi:hypothetical protein
MKVLMTLVLSCLVPWGAWAVNTVPIEGHVYLQPDVPPPSTKVSLEVTWFHPLCYAYMPTRTVAYNERMRRRHVHIRFKVVTYSLPIR